MFIELNKTQLKNLNQNLALSIEKRFDLIEALQSTQDDPLNGYDPYDISTCANMLCTGIGFKGVDISEAQESYRLLIIDILKWCLGPTFTEELFEELVEELGLTD